MEFQVNTYTEGSQAGPAVAIEPASDFVVVWTSNGQDGSSFGAFGRRFAFDGGLYFTLVCTSSVPSLISAHIDSSLSLLDFELDGEVLPLTDGLLILRRLFGFSGQTLTTGAYDTVNCTRCDAAAMAAHIDGLAM